MLILDNISGLLPVQEEVVEHYIGLTFQSLMSDEGQMRKMEEGEKERSITIRESEGAGTCPAYVYTLALEIGFIVKLD